MAPEFRPYFAPYFADVGGRLVHYVRGGAGPAVAMLHGSPQSHRALLPLAGKLAARFTVFAFDTPGYGASDPLGGGSHDIAAFGDALADTLQALGLGPIPVYGTHTGASIALEAANGHPDVVSRAVLDGFALFTPAERDALMRDHMPPIRPAWDGTHLVALWSKARDQSVFFPWFRHDDDSRRTGDPAPLAAQHQAVLDLLHAGAHYPVAYGASIRHDAAALCVAPDRVRLFYRATDVLAGHLARLPPGGPQARMLGDDADAIIADALAAAPSCMAPPPIQPARRRYGQGMHWRFAGQGPPLLLLHDLPGSSATAMPSAPAGRMVAAPDLPGWGLSPAVPAQDDPAALADLVASSARAMGFGDAGVLGLGVGGVLAGMVASRLGHGRATAADAPRTPDPAQAAAYPLDVAPRWDGGHLLAAWFRQRDALLFRPWFDRRAAAAIPVATPPDLDALQARVTAMLEASGPDPTGPLLNQEASCV